MVDRGWVTQQEMAQLVQAFSQKQGAGQQQAQPQEQQQIGRPGSAMGDVPDQMPQ